MTLRSKGAPPANNGNSPKKERRPSSPDRLRPETIKRLRALHEPDFAKALRATVEDVAWIIIAATAILLGLSNGGFAYLLVPIGWLVIGARQRGLATIVHEASHGLLSENKAANYALGSVSAWAIMQRLPRYIETHLLGHHRKTGHPTKDPDTAHYIEQQLHLQDPDTFIWRNILQLLSGQKSLVSLPYLFRDRLMPAAGKRAQKSELLDLAGMFAFWLAIITIVTIGGWWTEFVLIWVIPFFTTFAAIGWLIETAEHAPLIWTERNPLNWTRNRKGHWLEEFVTALHGEGYHRAHHIAPWVPFHRIKEAHAILMEDPVYAEFEARSGGLFTRGANGSPTILESIKIDLRKLQATTQGEIE